MKQNEGPFEELIIPRREMQVSTASIYRVYGDHKNFQLVEAGSALEAMSIIGNKNVYKIKRHDPLGDNVIQLNQSIRPVTTQNQNVLQNIVVENEAPGTIAPVQAEAAENSEPSADQIAAASQAAASSDAPLSNDDIDKLLNG